MFYSKEFVASKLLAWEQRLSGFTLPVWEELPRIDLYMDQVIVLLTQYLECITFEGSGEKIVTASAINNYVRTKIMPPPHKKKYSRIHIAYLIMICTLKQSMNIAYVQKMIPMGISEEEVKVLYNGYVSRHKSASLFFIEQVRATAAKVLDPAEAGDNVVEDMVATVAVLSGLSKLLTEKVLLLQNMQLPPAEIEPAPQVKKGRATQEERGGL